jgi:hypothetical protein
VRLAIIGDASTAYAEYQKEHLLREWGVERESLKLIESVAEAGGGSLFGPPPTSLFVSKDVNDFKKFVEALVSAEKKGTLPGIVGEGLIIVTAKEKRNFQSIKALVNRVGGTYLVTDSKETAKVAPQLLANFGLSSTVKNFLLDYAGQEYERLLSVLSSLEAIPKAKRQLVTMEDVYIRLPQRPGSIPPWELEKPLFAHDAAKTIETVRRMRETAPVLVVLFILKNSLTRMFRIAALQQDNPRVSLDVIAKTLKEPNNYPLKLAQERASRYGLRTLEQVAMVISETERQVKGGAAVEPWSSFEVGLIKVLTLLRSAR